MKYKLITSDGIMVSVESDINEAYRQARYFLRKAVDIEAVNVIEVDTEKEIGTVERY